MTTKCNRHTVFNCICDECVAANFNNSRSRPIESTPPKPDEPTFSHMLAMYLTRNGQDSRYPSTEIVQYEIENYMYQCGVVVKKEDKR